MIITNENASEILKVGQVIELTMLSFDGGDRSFFNKTSTITSIRKSKKSDSGLRVHTNNGGVIINFEFIAYDLKKPISKTVFTLK